MKLESGIFDFDTALLKSACTTCSKPINWTIEYDDCGVGYRSDCCGMIYTLYPETGRVGSYKEHGN